MQLAYHLVLFFDVLGQREKLRSLTTLPSTEEDIEHARKVLSETVGPVKDLRNAFKTSFQAQRRGAEWSNKLPPSERKRLQKLSKYDVRRYVFSDSIIISVPLDSSNEHCTTMNGVYCSLLAACSVMIVALTQDIPCRGGIDVGIGIEMSKSEVYGSALERAFSLESCKAAYPRIVVGEELVRYLRAIEGRTPTTDFGKCAIALASKCISLIFKDGDDIWALDYLGSTFKGSAGESLEPNFIKKAFGFAESEKKKWSEAGNTKLAQRYDLLLAYLQSRSAIWNIQYEKSE